ncbi:MAG: DeoR/GlpR family DNA-binding transcription regulator [Aerococcus sp.]|nr:DeoR/GlpR family DNA-binding transcription regulator [Aerococcus sp.]
MKNSRENIQERRQALLDCLDRLPDHTASITILSDTLKVSAMTVRRDLKVLEEMGKLTHTYGQATLTDQPEQEGTTHSRSIELIKTKLAEQAASYISDNNSIFINSSSTALGVVDYLQDLALTIITNNLGIQNKQINSRSTVILPGGEIRFPKKSLVGELALKGLEKVYVDIAVMGCSGISVQNGVSTYKIHESQINQLMIQHSTHAVILVADYRKIGNDANFFVSPLKNIDILITDIFADEDEVRAIEAQGIDVIQVDPTL